MGAPPSSGADENGESDGSDESSESGECGKNVPWMWRIFIFHAKRGPSESGDFDENREYDESIDALLCRCKGIYEGISIRPPDLSSVHAKPK